MCFIIIFSVNSYVFADENNIYYNPNLIKALNETENIKNVIGLKNVDFSKFEIANPIQCYNYTENGLEEGYEYYPLIYNSNLVAIAIKQGKTDDASYQISTNLVKYFNDKINTNTNFTIIYDKYGCYLFDAKNLISLFKYSEVNESRAAFNQKAALSNLSNIKFTNLSNVKRVSYIQSRADNSFAYCNVSHVSQQPYDNICWAACVASISNYLSGSNLSAGRVAINYFTATNFNIQLEPEYIPNQISAYSGYAYPYILDLDEITSSAMYRNLSLNYPIYGRFQYHNKGHACVIYAVYVSTSSFYVMDPYSGFYQGEFKTATSYGDFVNDGYYYYSDYVNDWLWLVGAVSRSF